MMGWVLRAVIVLAILTVIYLALSIYSSYSARKRIRRDYLRERANSHKNAGDADAFITARTDEFNRRNRWRLALIIYAFPIVIIAVLIWLAQFS